MNVDWAFDYNIIRWIGSYLFNFKFCPITWQ
jgi:hypothetical protein